MKTIQCIHDYLMPLEEETRFKFITSIAGGHTCTTDERVLRSLPRKFGGFEIPLFHENADIEFENSTKLTSSLIDLIKDQSVLHSVCGFEQ